MHTRLTTMSVASVVAGVDFVLMDREVTLHPNASRLCLRLRIINDVLVEETELFELSITHTSTSSPVVVTRANTTVSIHNDDCKFSYFIYYCYYCYVILCLV